MSVLFKSSWTTKKGTCVLVITFKAKEVKQLQDLEKSLLSALTGKKPTINIDQEKLELTLEASIE